MTTLNAQEIDQFFDYATKQNPYAKRFLMDIYYVLHLVDDLIDKDQARSDDDIRMAFFKAMIDIPLNPFFQSNCNFLCHLLQCFYLQWVDATKLQKGNADERALSYGLNEAAMDFISQVAFICGGHDWMLHISERVRKMTIEHQSFEEYSNA